jgi:predicted Zn-dependent protease
VLGVLGVPFGGAIAANVATGYARSFTRDEERAADRLGVGWAVTAGYDACGMHRTLLELQKLSAAQPMPWASTHPSHEERAELVSQLAVRSGGAACQTR